MKKLALPSIASVLCIVFFTGCAPRLPLSAVCATHHGNICVHDPAGKTKASYSSKASDLALGSDATEGVAIKLIRLGISGISRAGGQSDLNAISDATGHFERTLVKSEVESMLQTAGYNLQPEATASFDLKLFKFGLYKDSNEKAFAFVRGAGFLKDETGRRIWRGGTVGRSLTGYTLKEYSANPELYRQTFLSAAEDFTKNLYQTKDNAGLDQR